ncbi:MULTISPECIES: SRPBCC family protein [unclassified Lysobacter]|uniref:SRPBCC family protein n=1 Tax=unclassified Lysobacter TaxID=2635362 RepID=UPI001BEA3A2E|nr:MULTISPECIES: SRPBCC family protein [unclassified Lysobacter]MBT2748104.1 SRPBCC family protein [Lysobacter sp. ISL-42]MBT2754144.1 SRPBCC family protein [Lysobacter sp. ISL-50]MBT2776030.1 SRPBCC family protein [Lysobacter sp. ISL-54]MBT2784131.1 SRPBCC family protein [Lysobacter sp. ISL-52]
MNASSNDRIEREILLKAPRAKVWNALTDAESFGQWFGVKFQGQRFVPGQVTQGYITYPGYEHLLMQVVVQQLQPQRLFSFHWHPYAVDQEKDYSQEEPTLVEFILDEAEGGTLLRVIESGFDKVPAARREEAFRMNSGGWDEQVGNIQRYVE